MKKIISSFWLAWVAITILVGCKDAGTDFPPPPQAPPTISSLIPSSAAVGDTMRIVGSDFGSVQSTSTVTVNGQTAMTIVSWSSTQIRLEIPLGAASGPVIVTVSGRTSNTVAFTASQVLFSQSVLPIFISTCIGCHGGTNNLFLNSYSSLMAGNSANGPVVNPNNGEISYLVRMLRGTVPSKPQMPQGGPFLPDARINKVSTWITQGAINN